MMNYLKQNTWILAGVGGGCVLAAASLYFVYQQVTGPVIGSGISGILLVLTWVWLDMSREQLPGQRESAKQGLTATLIVLIGFALVVILQALVVRHDGRWDLTTEGRYSLSDHSLSVLKQLDKPVTVYAIFRKGTPDHERFTRLVRGANAVSNHINLVEVDPLFDVSLLRQVVQNENERERGRIGEYGAVVLTTDTQRQRMDGNYTETAFINALIRLDAEKRIDVCWSVGHGERDFESQTTPSGMGLMAQRMQDQNYTIRPLRVLSEGIPKECALLVVAGPQSDWLGTERDALASYIAFGGRALVLVDPVMQGIDIEGFTADFAQYGIRIGSDVVIEASAEHRQINAENEPLQLYYDSSLSIHPIVQMPDSLWAVLLARSVQWVGTESGGQVGRNLVESSAQSWAETDFQLDQPPTPDAEEEQGRIGLAAVVEITEPRQLVDAAPEDARGRLVVFGDSDFASNQLSSLARNGDFFLNAVAWLVGEESQLGQRQEGEAEFLVLTGAQQGFSLLVSIVLVPGLCLALGVWVLIRRRLR